jgi:hypothetical protein
MMILEWLEFFLGSCKDKIFQNLFPIRGRSDSRSRIPTFIITFFVNIYAVVRQVLPEYGCPLTFRFHIWALRRGDPFTNSSKIGYRL